MSRHRFSLRRVLGILLMLIAWGVASNRCALASMALTADAAKVITHSCCSSKGEPRQPAKPAGECCYQVNLAAVEMQAKLGEAPPTSVVLVMMEALRLKLEVKDCAQVVRTHGPPGVVSFAELVLQRSVLSHAPPCLV